MGKRLLILVIAIICTGTGAALTVNMKLIANPADALVKTIADKKETKMGNIKNVFDIISVSIAILLGLLGLHNFGGVGIGTVCAMLGIGRVIFIVNKICQKRLYEPLFRA